MNLRVEAPTLNLDCPADRDTIVDSLSQLQNQESAFIVLSRSEWTFLQAVWTKDGYALEYQDGADARRFVAREPLSAEEIQQVFLQYLAGDDAWISDHAFEQRKKSDPYEQAGRVAGRLLGRAAAKGFEFARQFKKGFDEGKK